MMKRTILAALTYFVLIALVSCTSQVAPASSETPEPEVITGVEVAPISPQVAENPETSMPKGCANLEDIFQQPEHPYDEYYGGDDPIRSYFITVVTGGNEVTSRAIGDQAQFEFLNEYHESHRQEKATVPALYEMIQYFDVPKEEFVKYNNEVIALTIKAGDSVNQFSENFFRDWMIDALYCEDEKEMIRRLIVPSAIYRNGELFNIYDILDLNDAELEALALTTEEWRKFARNAEWALTGYAPMASLEESMDTWAQRYSHNAAEYVYAAQHENRSCLEVVEFKISEFEARRNAVENPCVQ